MTGYVLGLVVLGVTLLVGCRLQGIKYNGGADYSGDVGAAVSFNSQGRVTVAEMPGGLGSAHLVAGHSADLWPAWTPCPRGALVCAPVDIGSNFPPSHFLGDHNSDLSIRSFGGPGVWEVKGELECRLLFAWCPVCFLLLRGFCCESETTQGAAA